MRLAVARADLEFLKHLICNEKVDVNGEYLKHTFPQSGKNILVLIVNKIYSLAFVTEQGESPLGVSVRKGNLDMIKWLVKEFNANVNGK